jgi:hypothetical protein
MAWDRKRLVRTLFIAEVVIGVVLSCYLFANVGSSSVSGDGFRAVWYALLISALSGASYLVIFKIQEQFNWGIVILFYYGFDLFVFNLRVDGGRNWGNARIYCGFDHLYAQC